MVELLEPPTAPPLEEDEEAGALMPLVLRLAPVIQMDEEQFFQFCGLNRDLDIERNANGEIVLMYPEGFSSGLGNAELTFLFSNWAKRDGTGRVCGSSGGFTLPNSAVRAPDVSWTTKARLRELPKEEWDRFAHLCPDFVVELRSRTDSMRVLKAKMGEYIANGARLGWLINPLKQAIFIYRPGVPVEELHDPETLSGELVLPGFVLKLSDLWKALAEEE
jgi:Uma2 family endonuclease